MSQDKKKKTKKEIYYGPIMMGLSTVYCMSIMMIYRDNVQNIPKFLGYMGIPFAIVGIIGVFVFLGEMMEMT